MNEDRADGVEQTGTDNEAKKEEDKRKGARSRKMLASSATTPQWLREKFETPPDVIVSHVVHKTGTLPHFQMRFQGGDTYEGKFPG